MRKRPEKEPPDELKYQPLGLVVQTCEYQLMTPLLGGGVTPGEVDPLTPIRGSEIRGHLRFWWRATRGGNPAFEGDITKMKRAEDALWGAATVTNKSETLKQHGAIQVEVEVLSQGDEKKPFLLQQRVNKWGEARLETFFEKTVGFHQYIAFPLNLERKVLDKGTAFLHKNFRTEWNAVGDKQDLPARLEQVLKEEGIQVHTVRQGVSFRVALTFSVEEREIVLEEGDKKSGRAAKTVRLNVRQEVEAALWAWETFGGIGARTRRGFGALRLLKVGGTAQKNLPRSNQHADVKAWLHEQLRKWVPAGNWHEDVPHLENTLSPTVAYARSHVFESWNGLISRYASFRQFRTKGNAGRSNWPEAEAIREQTGRRYYDYAKRNHPEKFPRAAFGLPILFHFKDEEKGDPDDTTLQGAQEGHERWASPLILRPLICGDGSAIGLAVVLKGSHMPPLVLKETDKSVQARLSKDDLLRLPDLDRDKLKGQADILQAFLNDLEGK